VSRAGRAAEIARGAPLDGAILDLDLGGEQATPVASQLLREGAPIVLATAARADELPARFRRLPRIEKPYELRGLLAVVAEVLGRGQPRSA